MKSLSIYHGYYVLLSTFALNFCAIGIFNSAGLYLGPLSSTFPSAGEGTLALYCTVQIVTGLSSSAVGGIAQDILEKQGIGLQWLFFTGGVFMMVGFFVSSIAYTLFGVLVGSLLMGIGMGFGGFMAGGICVMWFEAARGTMLLLAMSGQGLGNVFFAWATARILENYEGYDEDSWRPTMRCMGVLSFVTCAVASMSMRMPLPGEVEEYENGADGKLGKAGSVNKYGSLGSFRAEENNHAEIESPTNVRQQLRRRASAVVLEEMRIGTGHTRQSIKLHGTRRRSTMLGSLQAISHAPLLQLPVDEVNKDAGTNVRPQLGSVFAKESLRSLLNLTADCEYTLGDLALSSTNVWLNAFTLIACFPFLNMQVLLPQYIASLEMPPSVAGHALAVFGVGDFLSNLTLGVAADRVGARPVFTIAFFSLSLMFFLWPHCTTGSTLSTIAFFYGYFCCTISSMPIIILADAYGETSSEHILALNGITNMFKFPGYLLGSPIAGKLVEASGGYNLAAVSSGITTLIGTFMLLFIPSPKEQKHQLSTISTRDDQVTLMDGDE